MSANSRFHLRLKISGLLNPNTPLSSQACLFTPYKSPFMPFRHEHYLMAYFKTYLDGKLCKIDYALWPGRPWGVWRCVELSAPSLNGPRRLCFSISYVCFLLFSASSLLPIYCAYFISHKFLTCKMCLLKISFCFWKSERASILAITIHFLIQEFKVHTQWDSLISSPRDWKYKVV